jgi:Dolichyl-phosphate-mannose-protein mannosyltransferase
MQISSDRAASPPWLPRALSDCPRGTALALTTLIALAIRLYLSLTNFCISGDGIAYLGMAREFAAGAWAQALTSVFSPLYPWIVAIAHRLIPDWELAGSLVSTIFGSAAVATVYLMTREAFGRDDLAIGAAVLTAIHPDLAAYSASVRTEAGFVFLMTAAMWMLIAGLKRQRLAIVAAAGVSAGLAYLYRTEAIGFVLFVAGFTPVAAVWWRRWRLLWAVAAVAILLVGFLIVASPYMFYLHTATGHWTVGREFTAAMMYGMGEVAPNAQQWQRLGYSSNVSPFAPLVANPGLYLEKVAGDLLASLYGFIQALGPLLTLLLGVGIWRRGRTLLDNFAETMLALFTTFYIVGFSFSYTGARFMGHLIPFTFGWVMIGLETASDAFNRSIARMNAADRLARFPRCAPAIAIALILLPQTLWPIGYDMRGVRYAGEEIARRTAGKPPAVVARDGRFAYYAGASFIQMPGAAIPDLCVWLQSHSAAGYLALGNREERLFGISAATPCVSFIHRYPRDGARYYDLFAVQHSK